MRLSLSILREVTMAKLIVASAQQQMRLFDSPESYRKELSRFAHMARAKGAELIVFPALSGVMAASHKVEGFRINLLKQADERRRPVLRLAATLAGLAFDPAGLMRDDHRRLDLVAVLAARSAAARAAHVAGFQQLGRTQFRGVYSNWDHDATTLITEARSASERGSRILPLAGASGFRLR